MTLQNSGDQPRPLTAVFVLDISDYTGRLLAGWVSAGNRIGAIVVRGFRRQPRHFSVGNFRRRLQRSLLLRRHIGAVPVKLIEFGRPFDWNMLGSELSEVGADVLICYAFPNLIPQELLRRFPKGGLNLHPALLPDYRGPHPVHRLVVDSKHSVYGGVTLHKMSDGFDEGDILAQVPFPPEAWTSRRNLVASAAMAMDVLVNQAVPAYCRGDLLGMPQPAGEFTWARLSPADIMIREDMTVDHVARLWTVLGLNPGIYVEASGRRVRLGLPPRKVGPPSGKAAAVRWGTVEFDLADGRVRQLVYGRVVKRLVYLGKALGKSPSSARPELRLFGPSDKQ
jgi:methionyl-tRNA formyltransferase